MAKQTIYSPSAATVARTTEAVDRVLGDGGSTAATPYGGKQTSLYFLPTSQADDGTSVSRWNYTGTLHKTPNGAALSFTSVKGRNVNEARNTSTVRGGLTIEAAGCGSVIGIKPARAQVAYPVIGKQVIAGVTYYLFFAPNDPDIQRTA